jgi:hypothetical protein
MLQLIGIRGLAMNRIQTIDQAILQKSQFNTDGQQLIQNTFNHMKKGYKK